MSKFDPIKAIFQERQKDLVAIANTQAGRQMLNFGLKAQVIGVTPNAVIVREGKNLRGEFISGINPVANILLPVLRQIDATRRRNPQNPLDAYSLMRSHRFGEAYFIEYTAASGGTGGIYGEHVTYSTARGLATATGSDPNVGNETVGGNFDIYRWFCPTDFSAITPGSTVSAGSSAIWRTGGNTTTDDTAKFILTTMANPASLATADFDALTLNGPTTYGTTGAYSTHAIGAYSAVTMNAGFLTLVQSGAGGIIKLGMRATGDIDATQPTTRSFMAMSVLDNQRTKFDITWAPPSADANPSFVFFM